MSWILHFRSFVYTGFKLGKSAMQMYHGLCTVFGQASAPSLKTIRHWVDAIGDRTEGLQRTEGLLRTEGLIAYNKQSKVALPSGIFSNFMRSHGLDQIICYPRSDHLLSCTDWLVSLTPDEWSDPLVTDDINKQGVILNL